MTWLLLAGIGCGSIAMHDTARIASFQTSELVASVSVQRDASPVVGVLPLPVVDVVYRVPVDGDTDLGLKLLGGAPSVDIRRRIVRSERFDVTVAPAVTAAYLPIGLGGTGGTGVAGVGFAELGTPLLATAQISRRHSLTVSARPGLRLITTISDGQGQVDEDVNTMSPLLAGGLRWEMAGPRDGLALGVDVLARPGRGAPVAWSVSLQSISIGHRRRRVAHRRMKRSARGGGL